MNKKDIIILCISIFIISFSFITNHFFSNYLNNGYDKRIREKEEEFDLTNELNESNRYSIKNVQHEDMAKLYYNDYKNMIVNYPDEAYEIVENNNEITKNQFLKYRQELMNNYYDYNYVKYYYYQEMTTNNYVYRVTDSEGKVFTFKPSSVMNYVVSITTE